MAHGIDNLDFQRGDPLKAEQLQAIRDELLRPTAVIRGGAGLSVRQGARGQTQVTGDRRGAWMGKANGNIPAASGDTPGSGSVTRWQFNGTAMASFSANYSVLNWSTTTMTSGNGINSGQRCWVEEDEDGQLWVTPLECA